MSFQKVWLLDYESCLHSVALSCANLPYATAAQLVDRRSLPTAHPAGRAAVGKTEMTDILKKFYPEITTKQVQELVGKGSLTLARLQARTEPAA